MELKNKNGYNISCDEFVPNNPTAIVIAMHGFAGDKTSHCIQMLKDKVNSIGIGLISFDWPGHGLSEVGGEKLTIQNCLDDLDTVIEYTNQKYPNCKIASFATSFGGYLSLLYNYYNPNKFDYCILRAPAIKMHDVLFNSIIDDEMLRSLRENGFFDFGYERKMKVYDNFVNELEINDVYKLYENSDFQNISIIHGTKDDVVPITDSETFCANHQLDLYKIDNANHRFDQPGQVEEVVDIASSILSKKYLLDDFSEKIK